MPKIVYLDETGDHSLEKQDDNFPLFVLTMVVCEIETYTNEIVPIVYRLKFDYFGHEGVIIHSREIRKAQKDFSFLLNPNLRQPFYERINQIMLNSKFELIVSVIKKQEHSRRYGKSAVNPYDLALEFSMERLLKLLENEKESSVCIVAEARGKREDAELEQSFLKIISYGTSFCSSERFKRINFQLRFIPKQMNIIGTQLADLVGYPIARNILNPNKENPAYQTICNKFYKNGNTTGLKIFP